ncbi:NUDIX domain-containing protein [Microbacterium arborescens]|uniref:NUDIX domain-containing protein n=1 Tax=Microbacterium arborescens TaxID=33883 RepID=UPI003D2FCF20
MRSAGGRGTLRPDRQPGFARGRTDRLSESDRSSRRLERNLDVNSLAEIDRLRVVAAIIEGEIRIHACRRNREKAAGAKWKFPGGKVGPGESCEQALARQIRGGDAGSGCRQLVARDRGSAGGYRDRADGQCAEARKGLRRTISALA